MIVATWEFRVDGEDDYVIDCRREADGSHSLWCRQHPWCPYPTEETSTHLNHETGRVCIAESERPRHLEKAKAIAMLFCRGYSTYCQTGRFPNGGGRVRIN